MHRTLNVNIEQQILLAQDLSIQLEHLLFGKSHTLRTPRDEPCLLYWSLIFEIHQGILLLLQTKHYAPAFALIRPMAEAFARLHVAMTGTESQLASIKNGTYKTRFAAIGEQIDKTWKLGPMLGPWFKDNIDILHGFTHGGSEQLRRRHVGTNIVPNYPDNEVLAVVRNTTMLAFLTAMAITDVLGFKAEALSASEMFTAYVVE